MGRRCTSIGFRIYVLLVKDSAERLRSDTWVVIVRRQRSEPPTTPKNPIWITCHLGGGLTGSPPGCAQLKIYRTTILSHTISELVVERLLQVAVR